MPDLAKGPIRRNTISQFRVENTWVDSPPGFPPSTLLVSSTTASQSSSMNTSPPCPPHHWHHHLKDTVISSRHYTAQKEGLTHGRSTLCYLVDAHAWALVEGEACLWNLFRELIGAISRGKEVSCLLDFRLSGVRNEWFVGLEKLT